MAEEAKAAADTPPPPPDKEDGEPRCRNQPVDLHAIEQTQLRRHYHSSGRVKFDVHTGEVAEANAAPQSTAEGPHPLEHKWTFAAV